MAGRIVVLHGCCKGSTEQRQVEKESREAAQAVGAEAERVLTPYYACALDREVLAGGHKADLSPGCPEPSKAMSSDHADTDWDHAIGELLADPVNGQFITQLGLTVTPGADEETAVAGIHPVRQWADVHVFLTRRHQPAGRQVVVDAVRSAFPSDSATAYVLLAHSLGSIIAAHMISTEIVHPPEVFVTVGSQLGWSALTRFGWLSTFYLDGVWINLIDRADPNSGFFTRSSIPTDNGFDAAEFRNYWVKNRNPSDPHDFRGYMQTSEAIEAVSPFVR
jgi:hypothetical protein